MQGEISRLYYEYYRFAFDTARKAEQTIKRELMRPEVDATTYVNFNYWDGGRKGLLSGEALYLDLKRMEMAKLAQRAQRAKKVEVHFKPLLYEAFSNLAE
jgi:Tc toxin complex TcA C-terminal TcB-binding domain